MAGSPTPPSSPTADAELEEYVAKANRLGDLERVPALSAFLQRMERYPALSARAQAELVAVYQDALHAREELATGRLRGAATRKLRERASRADDAITRLIGGNFRLVLVIARDQASRKYSQRSKQIEVLGDLVSEGNVAIMEAATSYDPNRASAPQFPAYAARAVRDRIRSVLQRSTPMHLSPAWGRMVRIAQHENADLADELGRQPTIPELQERIWVVCLDWAEEHLDPEQARNMTPAQRHDAKVAKLRKQGMIGAITQIEQILAYSNQTASLDAPVSDEGSATLGEVVPDTTALNDPFNDVENDELRGALMTALSALSEREKNIILLRYGFVDKEYWTYNQIAAQFNVSAERIRQIERAVLRKLGGSGDLGGFLDGPPEDPDGRPGD